MEINRNNLEWWIDFVEGEQAYSAKSNVASLLEHSKVHRLIVENLKILKQTIFDTKDDLLPQGDAYYMKLKSNIMEQIMAEPRIKPYQLKKNKFQSVRVNLFL